MNVQEYIASGTLELYALGALTHQEEQEVSRLLTVHPELREELNRVELAMEALYRQVEVSPSAELKSKVLREGIMNKKDSNRFFNWQIAASLSLAILSVAASLFFYTRWQASEDDLLALQMDNLRLADNLTKTQANETLLGEQVDVLTGGAFIAVQLNGTDNAPNATATIYWNPTDNSLYLGATQMRSLSTSQQYQLWAIVDQTPVSLGVFDPGGTRWSQMEEFEGNPSAFAVTIEKRGGSDTPSLETMQVLGTPELS